MGEPGSALVEDDQITRRDDRPEQARELFGEREGRLPGAAGERDTALFSSPTGARWRRIARVIVPCEAPLGSSGTLSWPQANSLLPAHGANAIVAPADAVAATRRPLPPAARRTSSRPSGPSIGI